MEDSGGAGGDELVGAEKQYRCHAAAYQGYDAHGGQGLCRHRKTAVLLPCDDGEGRQGQKVAQKDQGHGGHAVGVYVLCHQRHAAKNDRTQNGV